MELDRSAEQALADDLRARLCVGEACSADHRQTPTHDRQAARPKPPMPRANRAA